MKLSFILHRCLQFFVRSERKLGIAEQKRRYDLPLDQNEHGRFLLVLIALMTFLALSALLSAVSLSKLSEKWSGGLSANFTIEIPALGPEGEERGPEDIKNIQNRVVETLKPRDEIETIEIVPEQKITAMLAPWLGDGLTLDTLPLPGLISVETKQGASVDWQNLKETIQTIDSTISIDRHEEWIGDLIRITTSLQLAGLVVSLIIIITTVIAVAGAILSRLAEYKSDVELLHLMGASDTYITLQFQRYCLITSIKGCIAGMIITVLAYILLQLAFGAGNQVLLPDIGFSLMHFYTILLVPVMICLISSFTATITVLRALAKMP